MSVHHADMLPSWSLPLSGETRLPDRGKTRNKAWLSSQFCDPENKSWNSSGEGRHLPELTIGWPSILGKSSFPGKLGWLIILPSERILMPPEGFLWMATFSLCRLTYNFTPAMAFPQESDQGELPSILDPNLFSLSGAMFYLVSLSLSTSYFSYRYPFKSLLSL